VLLKVVLLMLTSKPQLQAKQQPKNLVMPRAHYAASGHHKGGGARANNSHGVTNRCVKMSLSCEH